MMLRLRRWAMPETTVSEETYDPERVEQLRAMLRELAGRIIALDAQGSLLAEPGSLLKSLGDVRAELFRYEVRMTYDTPEIAEHRRMVADARGEWSPQQDAGNDEEDGWPPTDAR
jgi:hypothetical protein